MSSSLLSWGRVAALLCSILLLVPPLLCDPDTNTQPNAGYGDDSYSYYYNYNKNTYDTSFGNEYLSDWNHQEWAQLSGRIQQPRCVDIPSNLTLCRDIGYQQMMLPNLLDHDSLKEVVQQAKSWVPLVNINCHPDAKVFLCSLFSPVCLDRLIFPCRSLCEGVRRLCYGRMKTYGFDWPEMLKCDKFPVDNDMCIKLVHDVKPDDNCTACKHPKTHEALIDHFCRADFAFRVSLKDFKDVDGDKELVLRKKRKLFKYEGMSKGEARELKVIIRGGMSCVCETINSTGSRYLIMGKREGDKLVVNFGMEWDRRNKEFKIGVRKIRKGKNTCEGIFHELSATGNDIDPNVPGGGNKRPGKISNSDGKEERRKKRKRRQKKGKKGKKGKGKKKKKGKKNKKDKKDKKDKKKRRNRGKKGEEQNTKGYSKSQLEDLAISNFMKAAN